MQIGFRSSGRPVHLEDGRTERDGQELLHVGGEGRPPRDDEADAAPEGLLERLEQELVQKGSSLQ